MTADPHSVYRMESCSCYQYATSIARAGISAAVAKEGIEQNDTVFATERKVAALAVEVQHDRSVPGHQSNVLLGLY